MPNNAALRAARERTESPAHAGYSLARQELAELVNNYVWDHHKRWVELDANYIGKLERSVIRWPSRDTREALRVLLGVATDAELGFRNPRQKVIERSDVDRQQFLRASLGVSLGALVGKDSLAEWLAPMQTAAPTAVGATDVAGVREAAKVLACWDARYGGGLVREAVTAQLRYCTELLNARCTERIRSDLFAAVSDLADVAGFIAFDALAHDDARRTFQFGLVCAEHAQDWHARAKVLASMARQAIWCGDPETGLTCTETALVRSERLTATERAMLLTLRARALAKLNRAQQTIRMVDLADDEFSRMRPAEDPPWMAYYDAAQHAGDTGHALWDLAVRGRFVKQAWGRLGTAIADHGDGYARSRAFSQIKLASLAMAVDDPAEAAIIGGQALATTEPIRSQRAAADLRVLRHFGQRHEALPEVAELRHRIDSALVLA